MKKRCLPCIALACVISACQTQPSTPTQTPTSLMRSFYYPLDSSEHAKQIDTFINSGQQALYTALVDLSIDQTEISNLQIGYSNDTDPTWYFHFVFPADDSTYQAYYCIQNQDGFYNTILDHHSRKYDKPRGMLYSYIFGEINALLNYDSIDPTTIDQMIIIQPLTENDPLIVGINDQQYLVSIDENTGFNCQRLSNIPLTLPQPLS